MILHYFSKMATYKTMTNQLVLCFPPQSLILTIPATYIYLTALMLILMSLVMSGMTTNDEVANFCFLRLMSYLVSDSNN